MMIAKSSHCSHETSGCSNLNPLNNQRTLARPPVMPALQCMLGQHRRLVEVFGLDHTLHGSRQAFSSDAAQKRDNSHMPHQHFCGRARLLSPHSALQRPTAVAKLSLPTTEHVACCALCASSRVVHVGAQLLLLSILSCEQLPGLLCIGNGASRQPELAGRCRLQIPQCPPAFGE